MTDKVVARKKQRRAVGGKFPPATGRRNLWREGGVGSLPGQVVDLHLLFVSMRKSEIGVPIGHVHTSMHLERLALKTSC